MSHPLIRIALEKAIAAVSSLPVAVWENMSYTPVPGVPHAEVFVLTADPDNAEMSAAYTERGYVQVNLCYPPSAGPASAEAAAQALRAAFPRGRTLTEQGVKVHIERTPTIGGAINKGERYNVPVKIRFYAHIPVGG